MDKTPATRLVPTVTPTPWYKSLGMMLLQGAVYAAVVLMLASILSNMSGQSSLAARVDLNAQITVAAENGLRCLLTLRPDPDRKYKETQKLVDKCYKEYDKLVREREDVEG